MSGPPRDRHIPDLVDLQEAGAILGVSKTIAHRLAERGDLIGAKVGNKWAFRRVVVERLRDKRSGAAPTQ